MSPFRFRPRVLLAMVWMATALCLPGQEEPKLSEEQMRDFLLNAKVVADRRTSKGITAPYRLTLADGQIKHDALFQSINEESSVKVFDDGNKEFNFKDCYKYDIAAYELAKLLGLGDMMPVTVERKWRNVTGALSWWLPVKMDEVDRRNKRIQPPDVDAYNRQMYKKRIFAELVFDTDPNLTNVLISADWHLWMIDFTRAFRILKDLRNRENIIQSMCERQLFERLKTLDRNELTQKTKRHLTKAEIDGVMARRDKIVAIYTDLIAKKGENAVLYSDKRP
jgi:hypothetical protein